MRKGRCITYHCSRKDVLTQRLFANIVCLTPDRNCSTVGAGMHSRSAPILIRKAFSSGRKRRIEPSSFLCALRPSSNPCTFYKHVRAYPTKMEQTNKSFISEIDKAIICIALFINHVVILQGRAGR